MQVARAGGVPSSIAMTLSGCAGSLPLEEADRALELLDEAIEVGTEVGDHMAVDLAWLNKGMIAARRGDWRTALRLAADTARQQLDVGDLSGLPGSLGLAASAFSMVSRHEVAAVLLGRAGSMLSHRTRSSGSGWPLRPKWSATPSVTRSSPSSRSEERRKTCAPLSTTCAPRRRSSSEGT